MMHREQKSRTQFVRNFDRVVGTLVCSVRYGANGRSLTTTLAFAEFPPCFLLVKLDVAVAARENSYENFPVLERIFVAIALTLSGFVGTAHAEMASVYGGRTCSVFCLFSSLGVQTVCP
jgi:hypothetical protein